MGKPLPSATTLRANAIAAGVTSPSTISSNSLVPLNFSDFTGSPETTIFTAISSGTSRGRRCVPPAPGRMPSFTSGSAINAPVDATRKWQPSASSIPPPIATECTAATTGLADASSSRITVCSVGSVNVFGELNSRMSAPPENARPAPVITIALIAGSALALRSPSDRPRLRSMPSPFTGGLSIVITATSPCDSYFAWLTAFLSFLYRTLVRF